MPERRRFASPKLLLRAYAAHQHTRARLRSLTAQAEDEQEALDREMAELLARFPHGLRDGEAVFTVRGTPDRPVIASRPAPVEIYDVESWAEVEEWARRGRGTEIEAESDDSLPIGPGPDAPSDSPPTNADHYPPDGSLAMAGIEGRDDDGDDF